MLALLFTCLQAALSPPQREAKNLNGLHSQGCYCASECQSHTFSELSSKHLGKNIQHILNFSCEEVRLVHLLCENTEGNLNQF